MQYDFDRPIDRTRDISIKWSPQLRREMYGEADILPMGIADMDFPTAPAVGPARHAPPPPPTHPAPDPPRRAPRGLGSG